MTHTLHRRGSAADLRNDFVVFAMAAKGINREGAAPKLRRFFDILLEYDPVNYGDMKTGNRFSKGAEIISEGIRDNSIVHGVFTDEEVVTRLIHRLQQEDLGLSIVVSGLLDEVEGACQKNGFHRHTVEHSLGINGHTELLPDEGVLELATMCGHAMVSFDLIQELAEKVRQGRLSPEEAARRAARPCHCGVFNPARAEEIFARLAEPDDEGGN